MNYSTNSNELPLLERQQKIAHYMLLATVIATVVDIATLLGNMGMLIPYCASLPYYLTELGFFFDNYKLDTYTATGMVMAFAVLAVWLLVWWKAKTSRKWLLAGMILVIADTVILAGIAFQLMSDPSSCLWEGLLHLAVIYEIYVGLKASQQIEQLRNQQPVEFFDPWNQDTPTEEEYSDTLEQ